MGHMTIREIQRRLDFLSALVGQNIVSPLPVAVTDEMAVVVDHLEYYIPGLEPSPPDPRIIQKFNTMVRSAFHTGEVGIALYRAFRGLVVGPHSPMLWYYVAKACIKLDAPQTGYMVLAHVLWIHPGFTQAQTDIDAIFPLRDTEDI